MPHRGLGAHQMGPRPLEGLMKGGGLGQDFGPGLSPDKPVKASQRTRAHQTLEALLGPRPQEGLMKGGGLGQGLGPGLGPDKTC
jgi:hypothetical protein